MDDLETLQAKVKALARMIRASDSCVLYTGAGLSTATGMPDYASKANSSKAPHLRGKAGQPTRSLGNGNRLDAEPTVAHCVLAAMEKKGLVHHWLQQNHDRLAQKAGFPQAKLNEIHGAWGDDKNPVKMMDASLRIWGLLDDVLKLLAQELKLGKAATQQSVRG